MKMPAREEVDALRSGGAGFVKIGGGPSWQDAVLPNAIAELRAHGWAFGST
jgi:hypothetical protein